MAFALSTVGSFTQSWINLSKKSEDDVKMVMAEEQCDACEVHASSEAKACSCNGEEHRSEGAAQHMPLVGAESCLPGI